jgi:hypothetical protein
MNYRTGILLLIFFSGIVFASDDFSSPNYSSSAAEFLKLPPHADELALGEAVTASNIWSAASRYNPSLIDNVNLLNIIFSYSLMTLDRKLWAFDIAHPAGEYLVLCGSFSHYGVGGIESRDESGVQVGTFSDQENAVSVSVAGKFSKTISAGATIRYLFQQLSNEYANGTGFDLGATWSPLPYLRLGLSGNNLLSWLWWSTGQRDHVLPAARGGVCGTFIDSTLTIEIDGAKTYSEPMDIDAGVQYDLLHLFSFRVGGETSIIFNNQSYRPFDFTCGLGFHYWNFQFDYGLKVPSSELGLINVFSLSFLIPFN